MECQITDPYTTNQIVEVGVRKPKCFTFTGNTLNDWLKFIANEYCAIQDNNKEEVIDLVVNSSWDIYRQPQLYKRGNFVKLTGEVGGGDVGSTILTLPFTPPYKTIHVIAHEFSPTTSYTVYVKVDVDRSVKLYFTGTAPVGASSKLYLDSISFLLE